MNDCLISGVATTLSYVSRLFLDILKNVSFNNYMILNKYTLNYLFFYISKFKGFIQVNIIILNKTIAFLLHHLTCPDIPCIKQYIEEIYS